GGARHTAAARPEAPGPGAPAALAAERQAPGPRGGRLVARREALVEPALALQGRGPARGDRRPLAAEALGLGQVLERRPEEMEAHPAPGPGQKCLRVPRAAGDLRRREGLGPLLVRGAAHDLA